MAHLHLSSEINNINNMKQFVTTINFLLLFVSAVKTIELLSEYSGGNVLDGVVQMLEDEDSTAENMRELKSRTNHTVKAGEVSITRSANVLLPENKQFLDFLRYTFDNYGKQQQLMFNKLEYMERSLNQLHEERIRSDELAKLLQTIFEFIAVSFEELKSATNSTELKLAENIQLASTNNKLLVKTSHVANKCDLLLRNLNLTMTESATELSALITDSLLPKFNITETLLLNLETTQRSMAQKLNLLQRLNSLSENIFVSVRTLNNSLNSNNTLGSSDSAQLLQLVYNLQKNIDTKLESCHNTNESVGIEIRNLNDSHYALQTQVGYLKNLTDDRINELTKMIKMKGTSL